MKKLNNSFIGISKRALCFILVLLMLSSVLPIAPSQMAEGKYSSLPFDIVEENSFPPLDEWAASTYVDIPFTASSNMTVESLSASYTGPTGGNFIAPIVPVQSLPDFHDYTAISDRVGLEAISNNLSGKYYLTNDIDLSGAEWVPIGDASDNRFTGVFDGQGYIIRNLTVAGEYMYAGLFGIASDAMIKNSGLEGTNIEVTSLHSTAFAPDNTVGGIVGIFYSGSIYNCYNTGVVSTSVPMWRDNPYGGATAGGIVGFFLGVGTISYCYNTGDISAFAPDFIGCASGAGGIVGGFSQSESGSISYCYNFGDISALSTASYAGGICGPTNTNIVINNCYNSGSVYAQNSFAATYPVYAGGIVSYAAFQINNCYNTGGITARNLSTHPLTAVRAGGIVAQSGASINNCYNKGGVTAYNTSSAFCGAGGIVASTWAGVNISNCYNTGDTNATNLSSSAISKTGGIIGEEDAVRFEGSLSNCYWYVNNMQIVDGVERTHEGKKGVGNGEDTTTPLTSEEMKNPASFFGFDFINVWDISPTENDGLPVHREQPAFTSLAIDKSDYTLFEDIVVTFTAHANQTWLQSILNDNRFEVRHNDDDVLVLSDKIYNPITETITCIVKNPINATGLDRLDTLAIYIDGQNTDILTTYTNKDTVTWATDITINSPLNNDIIYYTGGTQEFTATINPTNASFVEDDFIWFVSINGAAKEERATAKRLTINPLTDDYTPGTQITLTAYSKTEYELRGESAAYGEITFIVSGEAPRTLDVHELDRYQDIREGESLTLRLISPAHVNLMGEGIRYVARVWEYVEGYNLENYKMQPSLLLPEANYSYQDTLIVIDDSSLGLSSAPDGVARYFVYVSFTDNAVEVGDSAVLTVMPRPLNVTFNDFVVFNAGSSPAPISWNLSGSGTYTQTVDVRKNGQSLTGFPQSGNGSISVQPEAVSGLRDEYTVRVTVTNQFGGFATENVTFYVYNSNALSAELGTSIIIDNSFLIADKSSDEILAMRDQLSLTHPIQLGNAGFAWGIDDGLTWQIENNDVADVLYLAARGWTRTTPDLVLPATTPIRITGNKEGTTTLTVTHKQAGFSASVPVSVALLDNKLYIISVTPAQTSQIMYDGLSSPLQTNSRGEIAIYAPNGIPSDVTVQSALGDDRWIGTLKQAGLVSGENPSGLYPTNSIKLTLLSNVTFFAVKPDGTRYQGNVQITGGLFRNGNYLQSSEIRSDSFTNTTDATGRIFLQLNTDSFGQINPADTYKYVFEVRFLSGNYAPQIVEIDAMYDARDALRGNAFTIHLWEWYGDRQALTYSYNGNNVTNQRGSIGPSDETPTGTLVIRAALPGGKTLTRAQIVGVDGSVTPGQSAKIIDNLPFLTDISYAEITWNLDRNTVPVGASKSFNVLFSYTDNTSRMEQMPFSVSNTFGMRALANNAAFLRIPVNTRVNTALLTHQRTLDGKRLPDFALSVPEMRFNVELEETGNTEIYKFYGYLTSTSAILNALGVNDRRPFSDRFAAVKSDVIRNKINRNSYGADIQWYDWSKFVPEKTVKTSVNITDMAIRAYVEGFLVWNPNKNNFDLIISEGGMVGEESIRINVTLSFPLVWFFKLNVAAETSVYSEMSMNIFDNPNDILITNYTANRNKLSAGVSIELLLGAGGAGVYGEHLYSVENASRYNVVNRTVRHGSRDSVNGEVGFNWWARLGPPWPNFLNKRWSGKIGTSLINTGWQYQGDSTIFAGPRGVQAFLNSTEMSKFNTHFLTSQFAPAEQMVQLSMFHDNPSVESEPVIVGDSSFAIAAWEGINSHISQEYLEELEALDEIDFNDFLVIMNQTEIFASIYNGTSWSDPLPPLTDNGLPDGNPVVAVDAANKSAAIVWQRQMIRGDDIDGIDTYVELWYATYRNELWSNPARLDYIGENTFADYQVAMNSAGFAVIIGTSSIDSDTSDVTAYFVDWSNNITKTVLTNRNALNLNPQITAANDGFYLSWYSFSENGNDIIVRKMLSDGTMSAQAALSAFDVSGLSALNPTMAYRLVGGSGNQVAILCKAYDFDAQGDAIYALKLTDTGGQISLSAPLEIVAAEEDYWLEITGGELSGNQVTVEFIKYKAPESSEDDINGVIDRESKTFANTILGGAVFSDLDVAADSDLLVTFGVANTGIDAVNSVVITVGANTYVTSSDLIQPGAVSVFEVKLPVGETLSNIAYNIAVTFTNGNTDSFSDTLTLAKPDVSIGQITTLVAEKGEREFSVHLFNDSDVPLKGTGYEVRLSFFEDPMRTIPANVTGRKVITSSEELELLDVGGLNMHYSYAIPAEQLENGEIPELGIWLYVQAEIWNGSNLVEQRSYLANQAAIGLQSLIKHGEPTAVIVADTEPETGGTKADLHISNRSIQPLSAKFDMIKVSLYDANDNVIEVLSVEMKNDISAENTATQSIQFTKSGTYALALFETLTNDSNGNGNNGGSPAIQPQVPEAKDSENADPHNTITRAPETSSGFTATITKTRTYTDSTFTDVVPGAWYVDAVRFVYEYGVMNGVSATRFSPNSNTTRAQIITILARLNGLDTDGGETWYSKAVEWAMQNGISDGTNLYDNVTREQLVTMLWRFAGEPKVDLQINFTDAGEVSYWAADAMKWAISIGLIKGYDDGSLMPRAPATRAEVATIIQRYMI